MFTKKNLTEEEKIKRREDAERKMQRNIDFAKGTKQIGNSMMGCGCLLTLLITIPIIIIVIFLL